MLDNGFNGGYVVTPYLASGVAGTLIDQCNAVGVQSTGKVISAGVTDADGPGRVMVTRHTTAGALDGTFAGGATDGANPSSVIEGECPRAPVRTQVLSVRRR
jgi:hypothetical protein